MVQGVGHPESARWVDEQSARHVKRRGGRRTLAVTRIRRAAVAGEGGDDAGRIDALDDVVRRIRDVDVVRSSTAIADGSLSIAFVAWRPSPA